jgi:hypothetical protein
MENTMQKILDSIEKNLHDKNWYAALILSLILPDICTKVEGKGTSSSKRYSDWFNKYLKDKYNGYLSGSDCYALRCSLIHEGSSIIENQSSKDIIDRIYFVSEGSHCILIDNGYFDDPTINGKKILVLSVKHFCQDLLDATKDWLNDQTINKEYSNLLEIHETGLSIGGGGIRIE